MIGHGWIIYTACKEDNISPHLPFNNVVNMSYGRDNRDTACIMAMMAQTDRVSCSSSGQPVCHSSFMDGVFGRLWCQVCLELWEARALTCAVLLMSRGTGWEWEQCWSPSQAQPGSNPGQLCVFERISYFLWVQRSEAGGKDFLLGWES